MPSIPSPRRPVRARYTIRVRDNNRVLLNALGSYRKVGIARRFNNMSDWTMELSSEDPVALALMNPGYGIQMIRSLYRVSDGALLATTTEVSGPVDDFDLEKKGNTLTVHGRDDTEWLSRRRAYPVTNYPYPASVLALPGLLRYYKLGESSGTSAVDSKSAINGTYNGSPVLAQKRTADDVALSPVFDGVNDYISAATTGLPTGNNPVYLGGWIYLTSYIPSSQMSPFWYGANVDGTRTGIYPAINADGTLQVKSTSTSASGNSTAIVTLNTPHLLGVQYDGTVMSGWLDGVQIISFTPGTLALGTDAFQIARKAGGNFMPGYIGHVFVGSGTLTSAQWLAQYKLGFSRFANAAYDTRTGAGETVIRGYVNDNAAGNAIASRQVPGLTVLTDSGRGTTVAGNARFDKMVSKDGSGLLQTLAASAGVGFRVAQNGTNLELQFYVPQDRSATVRFSDDLRNVEDYKYSVAQPDPEQGGNMVIVGGSGDLTDRIIVLVDDATSISTWGRTEFFQDARDTSDYATLVQRGQEITQNFGAAQSFDATLAQTPSAVYGLDFFLGDLVTVIAGGATWSDIVREVDITLDGSNAETVVPIIGTANAKMALDELSQLRYNLNQLRTRLQQLQFRK